jgi:hypothetical protein
MQTGTHVVDGDTALSHALHRMESGDQPRQRVRHAASQPAGLLGVKQGAAATATRRERDGPASAG